MTGRSETLFDNYGVLTRAEAAAVITRMIDKDKRITVESAESSGSTEIQPEDAFDMMRNGAVLIDVRIFPDEFKQRAEITSLSAIKNQLSKFSIWHNFIHIY